MGICLFVSRIMQNHSTSCNKIGWTWKSDTLATEKKQLEFDGDPNHIMLGLAVALGFKLDEGQLVPCH